MKNLIYFLPFLLGIMVFSCTNSENLKPQSKVQALEDTTGENIFANQNAIPEEEELIPIGIIQDGEIQFTVSNDQLANVYAYNVELNTGQTGVMESAEILPNDDEEETEYEYFLVMSGSEGDEGSGVFSVELISDGGDTPGGDIILSIRSKPVWAGYCRSLSCNRCFQELLSLSTRICPCQVGPDCPYIADPIFGWIW